MANALYTKAKQKLLEGHFNIPSDTIRASLVDAGQYTADLSNHDFRNDVPDTAVLSTVTLTGKTVIDGVFDADDAVFTGVSGATIEYILLWKDTGSQATSALIALFDTATGLPTTPNGGDITVRWDSGTNKIFRLS